MPVRLFGRRDTWRVASSTESSSTLDIVQWSPRARRHGYYMTWAHKRFMWRALRDGDFTHFAYLEDDMLLLPHHLDYWCKFRTVLRPTGRIPAFVRFECDGPIALLTDQTTLVEADWIIELATGGGDRSLFVRMQNPYQGMYLMDRDLAAEHFAHSPLRSPFFSRFQGWEIRERAAAGPIFEASGSRLEARNVAPVEMAPNGHMSLFPDCLIEHVAANYARDETSDFASIPVRDAFSRLHDQPHPQ